MSTPTIELAPSKSTEPHRTNTFEWSAVLLACVVLLANAPLFLQHLAQLWRIPHYQFFPLLLVGAAALAWRGMRHKPLRLKAGGPFVTCSLLVVSWLLLAAAELFISRWLASVSTITALITLCYAVGGTQLLGRLSPAILMLCLLIPLPFELDIELVYWLRALTSGWASRVLDLLGIHHLMEGNVIVIGQGRLLVDEACSGINSLFSVVACTLFLILWFHRRVVHALLLAAAAIAWVLVANVARVVLLTWLKVRWNLDLLSGWKHEVFGMLLFLVAVTLLWSTDRFLLFVFSSAESSGSKQNPSTEQEPSHQENGRRGPALSVTAWPFVVAFLGILLARTIVHGLPSSNASESSEAIVERAATLDEEAVPLKIGDWTRTQHRESTRNPSSAYGEFSKTWQFVSSDGDVVTLSLDYPFPKWHDLTRCYTSQGWRVEQEGLQREEDGLSYAVVALKKSGFRRGLLFYCEFSRSGQALQARAGGTALIKSRRNKMIRDWWNRLTGDETERQSGAVYQIQLFVETPRPAGQSLQQDARNLFLRCAKTLSSQLAVSDRK